MENKILKYSDRFYGVLLDRYAVEKECVPPKDVLDKALEDIHISMANKPISDLTLEDYHTVFQKIISRHNYELNNTLPTEEELLLITDTFKYIVQFNDRWSEVLSVADLWGLCILYNIVFYEKNSKAYLDKFKKWRVENDVL